MKDGVGNQWMTIPSYSENIGGPFIFDCNQDEKLPIPNNKPLFYIDVLEAWVEVQELLAKACSDPSQGFYLVE